MANGPSHDSTRLDAAKASDDTAAGEMKAFLDQRRRKNMAVVCTVFGLAALFFLITIVRMDIGG